MTKTLAAAATVLLSLGAPASAHRLDEYLQATIISVEKDRVQAFMRLVPGVAAYSAVIASIDTDGNGVISETEQQTYAYRVLHDLSLSADGHPLRPRLVSVYFPRTAEMKEGLGEIQIEFTADLPGGGTNRRFTFQNNHQRGIAAYMVNCLVPRDKNIRITGQNRSENQSFYQLDYVHGDGRSDLLSFRSWPGAGASLGTIALLLSVVVVLLSRQRAKVGITR